MYKMEQGGQLKVKDIDRCLMNKYVCYVRINKRR